MKILVTGSSGLVGSALVPHLKGEGHEVIRLVRSEPRSADEVAWYPDQERLAAAELVGVEGVVHLAGENIASGRWTPAKKRRIEESRTLGTRNLAQTLARLEHPPRVLVSASAIGFYGDRGDELLDENAAPGTGFLADVCRGWEQAADAARDAGVRVVHPRIGVVLSSAGGALTKMLLPFKLGLGGPMGDGRQWMSWITRHDLVRVLTHALGDEELAGPINAVTPNAVRFRDFARTLGRVLSRPAFMPMPAFAARLALGEMADELLLASARVVPTALEARGFSYEQPDLEGALRTILKRSA